MLDRPLPLSYTSAPLFCPFTVSPFIIYCPIFTENPPTFICLVVWSLERGVSGTPGGLEPSDPPASTSEVLVLMASMLPNVSSP